MERKQQREEESAIRKKRENLFKKARELSTLCDAEIAIINLISDGNIAHCATSNMKRILTRFNMYLKSKNRPTLPFLPEELEEQAIEEVDSALMQDEQEPKSKKPKLEGKDLKHMNSEERFVLHQRIKEGILHIRNRKAQLMKGETEELKLQKGCLQGSTPSTNEKGPNSHEIERNTAPGDGNFVASTDHIYKIKENDEDLLDTTLSLGPTWGRRSRG